MNDAKKKEILAHLNKASHNTLAETVSIVYTDVSEDSLTATMPVTPTVHQPYGIMHGGATCVLAETLGSCLSLIDLDITKSVPVGININSNHLRAIREGVVTGTATFIRKGSTLHVSQIEIRDEKGHLISHTTMTNSIIPVGKV
ncbi:MAG: PaaI family thioesterase [Weeksellaceae bacterium]|nr:PaaI family thioesterase [Weeksellaceae bacterium]